MTMTFAAPAAAGALAVLLTFTAANPAVAGSSEREMRQRVVSYGDLDLTDPDGVRTFRSRVKRAVGGICGPVSVVQPVSVQEARRACAKSARADAAPKVEAAVRMAHEQSAPRLLARTGR